MNKTVASVIDDINEWENPRGGSVFYVTAICTDEDVLSVGRKDHDAALEVQGLLREAIGVEQDFVLEPAKPTKTGRTKWKVLGFGIPGGAATYTAPGVQGGVSGSQPGGTVRNGTRSPEHDVDASIRAAVALKAAASFLSMSAVGMEKVLEVAEFFEEWLQRKASEPASSAYSNGSGTVTPVGQAGAGSEDRGEEVGEAAVAHLGEGTPASSPHIHDYQLRQGVKGFLVCECGKTRKKETV
jgi:hypothetical protein